MNAEFHFPLAGVLYREGLEDKDYDEAIEALQDAKKQKLNTSYCAVCSSIEHNANTCHHNPLVMARRAITSTQVWRCYHCGEVFINDIDAQLHFGTKDQRKPKCLL